MGKISEIVNVSITRESLSITQAGFGTTLLLVEGDNLGVRVEAFGDTSELLTNDRFGTNSIAYKAALALMGQDKKPEQFKVGMKGTTNRNCAQRVKFDAVATAGTFTLSFNGQATANIDYNESDANIATAIEALDGISSVTVTTVTASTEWEIEFDSGDANKMFKLLTVDVTNLTGPTTGVVEFGHLVDWGSAIGVDSVTFTVTVDGVSKTTPAITSPLTATSVLNALSALDNVGTGNVEVSEEATDETYFVKFVGDLYGTVNTISATATSAGAATVIDYVQGQADETWAQAYTACAAYDSDFYALTTPGLGSSSDVTDQDAIAALIEAEDYKIYSVKTYDEANIASDYNGASPSDISETLKAKSYDKSFVTYQSMSKATTEYPDCAILGRQLTRTPGSSTYKFKILSGITSEALSTTAKNYLNNKSCNWNETFGSTKIYREGTVASGEFIDVIVGIDYLSTRMAELVFAKLAAVEKLPYTPAGTAVVESLVRTALKLYGVDPGIIDGTTITVSVPDVASVSPVDRANRILRNVKFSAKLQGAIHKVYIEGTVYA